jgi:long-chain acyl-CoA synthetase
VLSICVYADPNRYKPIAIVVPAEATLSKFAVSKGLAPEDTHLDSLVDNKTIVEAVYAELLNVGKRGGLNGIELIQGLVLVPEEWTPENVCREMESLLICRIY